MKKRPKNAAIAASRLAGFDESEADRRAAGPRKQWMVSIPPYACGRCSDRNTARVTSRPRLRAAQRGKAALDAFSCTGKLRGGSRSVTRSVLSAVRGQHTSVM